MAIYKTAFAPAIFILLVSCSGLKKTQVEATEKYAVATKGISRVPSDIYFRIYQLKAESQTLQLNTLLATNDQTKESIELIKNDYEEKVKFMSIAEEYSTAYMIVEKYATLVLCLINDKYLKEFNKTKTTWQGSFEKMIYRYNTVSVTKIPSSVSNFTANVIQQLGKLKIGQLQKKYLKEAIHTARIPFENICDDFIQLDSLKIKSELTTLPVYLDNNYANFLENVRAYEKQGNNPYLFYNQYTPIYTSWLNQLGELNALSNNTVNVFRKLKTTYAVLEAFIDGNGAKVIPPEIDELMKEYGTLIETYQKFQIRKEKLNAAALTN